jgi:putative transposase
MLVLSRSHAPAWERTCGRFLVPMLLRGNAPADAPASFEAGQTFIKKRGGRHTNKHKKWKVQPAMTRDRYRITCDQMPHFLTCTIVNWIPIFTRPEAVQIVFDSLRYLQSKEELTLFGFVIMENHLHLIASSQQLSNVIARFKSFTGKQVVALLSARVEKEVLSQLQYAKLGNKVDRDYQVWQEGSHPVLISNEDVMRQKLEYMHFNPVRRGYVDEPTHWRYSSARDYAGGEGLIGVTRNW